MTQKDLQVAIHQQRQGRRYKAARYPSNLRMAVAEFVRTERSRGRSLGSVAEGLDLPINTLRRWSEKHPSEGRLKSVEVVADAVSDTPVLVTSAGHRVEGLSMTSLFELLERLG